MIDRLEAWNLLCEKISNVALRRHMLATEVVLRALARRLGRDETLWGLTGLLHDIDLESVDQDMRRHAATACAWLSGLLPEPALQAIRAHNAEMLGGERLSELDHALTASESLTGLVVATVLILPDKKISALKVSSVQKRMKEPRFAAAVNRDMIRECEAIGIPLGSFVELGVAAMQQIGEDLGLGGGVGDAAKA